jgi:hypothetical protein
MTKFRKPFHGTFITSFIAFVLWALSIAAMAQQSATPPASAEQALKSLARLNPIDVHVHVFKHDPAFQAFLEKANLKLLNILVVDDTLSYRKQLAPQVSDALALVRDSQGRVALCTTFDAYKFNDPSFPTESIKQIDKDFANGAVAVKVWKNIGMEGFARQVHHA